MNTTINLPDVLAEMTAVFARYEDALRPMKMRGIPWKCPAGGIASDSLACQITTRGEVCVLLGNCDWRTRLTAWPRGSNTALRTAVVSDKPSTTKMLGE